MPDLSKGIAGQQRRQSQVDNLGVAERVTTAQQIMQREMTGNPMRVPRKLDEVLDGLLGAKPDRGSPVSGVSFNVEGMALDIIDQSENMTLTFAQWRIVQQMVEQGIRTGLSR